MGQKGKKRREENRIDEHENMVFENKRKWNQIPYFSIKKNDYKLRKVVI